MEQIMSMGMEHYLVYRQWTNKQEHAILRYFDPTQQYLQSPTAHYPLADFSSALAVVFAYLMFVVFGTMIMKSPSIPCFNTRPLQFIYNPLQIILCSYMCVEAGLQAYRNNYTCLPCNKLNLENPVMGNIIWMFYVSKVLDFCDTFFIILGKKWKQLSFLHVYHHLTIFSIYWLNMRVAYDGDVYLTIILNGFIHTIMYTYYFLSAHTKNIWWKKYLTAMQMVQFLTMNVQGAMLFFNKCKDFPERIASMYFIYIQTLFWLFAHFFVSSYIRPAKSGKKET